MISQFQQYVYHEDGTITSERFPGLTLETIEAQGHVTGRDIETELRLPTYFEDWQELAKPIGLSRRQLRFILMDESATRLPGHYRFEPQRVTLPTRCHLEFAHRGFLVGVVHIFVLGFAENRNDLSQMGIEIPSDIEGDCILAQAQLFKSPLAEKAWKPWSGGS